MKLKKLILLAAAVTVMTAGCGNGAESSGPGIGCDVRICHQGGRRDQRHRGGIRYGGL